MADCTHGSLSKWKEDVENVHQLFDSDRFGRRILNQFDDDQLDFMDRLQESNISSRHSVEPWRVSQRRRVGRPTFSMHETIWSELWERYAASRASMASTAPVLDRTPVDSRPIHADNRSLEYQRTVEELLVRRLDTNRTVSYIDRSTSHRNQLNSPAEKGHCSPHRSQ